MMTTSGSEAVARHLSVDAAFIERLRTWSIATFGPPEHRGPLGPLAHIRKEIEEVEADPYDVVEWIDVVILALDGAWRSGHDPQQILDALHEKFERNLRRTWPDWRDVPGDIAIGHLAEAADYTEEAHDHA